MALNSIVISDSTTLISLINIERFMLLFRFSDTIIITPSVYSEVTIKKSAKRILDKYISLSKVKILEVENIKKVKELLIRLDLGESESIVLAEEQNLPLIIDEKKGKKIALSFGLETIGLVGILLVYKKKNYLSNDEIVEIVKELREVSFRVSDALLGLLLEE
jgi:predicted nucleic acid-binding protein